jgi:hypothetical protein
MNIIPLTLSISLTLAFSFVVFFLAERRRGNRGGPERDSLLPLAEESRSVPAQAEERAPIGMRRTGVD